jgi:anti-anti-sigma factor
MSNAPVELPDKKKTPLIEIDWNGSVLILRLVGPNIGQRESPIITEEFHPYFKRHGKAIRHMVLDLTNVNFMSSMGLGMCIACRNLAAAQGATSILYGLNKDLQALMAMMKIEKMYKIAKSNDELQKLVR